MFLLRVLTLCIIFKTGWCFSKECGVQNFDCQQDYEYRTVDGTCNNLKHPVWGSTNSLFDRLLPPKYGNGLNSFALSVSGKDLPNARKLTTLTTGEKPIQDSNFTLTCMQYGELITHDLSANLVFKSPASCCTPELTEWPTTPEDCTTIPIPDDDPYFKFVNATCLSLLRTVTNDQLSCSNNLKYSEQISGVNSYLDLSVIYGNTDKLLNGLRSFKNGNLLVEVRNNYEWLPRSITNEECPTRFTPNERCYRTGDARMGQNPQLIVLHVLWVREHNKIANELHQLNPHWDDEKIFQEARRIAIAEHQHITYYEMLPCYLGYENCVNQKLIYENTGFINDYNESARPHALNEHAHGAFKHFHNLIAGNLDLMDGTGCPFSSVVLRDHMNRAALLEDHHDNFDGLVQGLSTQPQMAAGTNYVPDMTRFAFMRGLRFGHDIRAVDVQRGRDHGLASYNDMREFCGLEKATHFEQFLDVIDKEDLKKLKLVYEHPDDVDLLVGGGMERIEEGTLAGPTFLCIMYQQFYRTRISDRFWYENQSSGLTLEQLKEIKKFSISKLYCNNGNNISYIQKYGFLLKSPSNPRVHCSKIEGPNLKLWKEST